MKFKVEVFAAVFFLAAIFVLNQRLGEARRATVASERVRDSLYMEEAVAQSRADGWAVQFGELEMDLLGRVARRDSASARLAAALDRANAKVRSLVEVVASLSDSLTSVGAPGDTTAGGDVAYNGGIDDGLLTGSWRFLRPDLTLLYRVSVPLEIIQSEGGDGRWLITARATDPRATVNVAGFYVNPPQPVQVAKCTLTQTAWRFGLGVLAGAFVPR